MLRRLALLASLLASMGAVLCVRAASADEIAFSAPVTGMGNWLFEGPLDVHDGKFQQTFTSGNARLQVWGSVDGDHIRIGGQVKETDSSSSPAPSASTAGSAMTSSPATSSER
jgi:hypothetical protein